MPTSQIEAARRPHRPDEPPNGSPSAAPPAPSGRSRRWPGAIRACPTWSSAPPPGRRPARPPATSSSTCDGPRAVPSARRRPAWCGSCSGRPDADPFVGRMLVQVLLPGLVTVAGKLRWGQGGEWQDGEEFFGELAGDDVARPAGMGRAGPPLRRARPPLRHPLPPAAPALPRQGPRRAGRPARRRRGRRAVLPPETDLEELARILVDLHRAGMRTDDVQVLYAHHVLGYSIAELAAMTGRDRRALYARRDRGQRRLCA